MTTDYTKDTDQLSEESASEANVLLADRDTILEALAESGMHEDETSPYTYYIPDSLVFDCGSSFPIRSICAVVIMARASFARACLRDCDSEGMPEMWDFTERGKKGFHRVFISDPFALRIDKAIQRHQEKMVSSGKARIVNGRYYKVA